MHYSCFRESWQQWVSFWVLHPEENFDATLHENFNDLDKHLINDRTVLIETLKRTESGYSPPPPITFKNQKSKEVLRRDKQGKI